MGGGKCKLDMWQLCMHQKGRSQLPAHDARFPPPVQVVAPKRAALAEANKRLEGANKKLTGIRARVKELQDRVAALEESLMRATEDKNNAVAQVRLFACSDLLPCLAAAA